MKIRNLIVAVYLILGASGVVAQVKKGDMSISMSASLFQTTERNNENFGVI